MNRCQRSSKTRLRKTVIEYAPSIIHQMPTFQSRKLKKRVHGVDYS
jgi:hypothetical protein